MEKNEKTGKKKREILLHYNFRQNRFNFFFLYF